MTFAAQAFPSPRTAHFVLFDQFVLLALVELHSIPTLTHSRRHPPSCPLFQTFPFMMQDIERGLETSSSGSQHPVIVTEQPVSERAQSGAGSLAQKVEGKLLGVSQELYKGFRPPRLLKEAPNFKQSLHAAFHRSWWNILLIFVPVSFVCFFSGVNNIIVFCVSFLAIIPIPKISDLAANEISKRLGSLGELPGLTWSIQRHISKLIVAIQAIRQCQPKVAQSSLIGSIISNLLLTLGMSIFLGGIRFSEQSLGMTAAQTYSSLLMLVVAPLLPTLFYRFANKDESTSILEISHIIAMVQLFAFICFQLFRRYSHKNIWGDNDPSILKSEEHPKIRRIRHAVSKKQTSDATTSNTTSNLSPSNMGELDIPQVPPESTPQALPESIPPALPESRARSGEEHEKPKMCLSAAIVVFAVGFVAIFYIAGALISSIEDLAFAIYVSTEFASLIVLPLADNVEDKFSALKASFKDKAIKALDVAVGLSVETALFIFPVTVIGSWIFRMPLPLLFDTFEAVVLFLSVLIANYIIKDGKSNWMEGMTLMCIYAIFAVTFCFYPGSDLPNDLVGCGS